MSFSSSAVDRRGYRLRPPRDSSPSDWPQRRAGASTSSRLHVGVGGLDDPEVGEVLLVSNVGGSSLYGWNRSVVYCVTYVTCFSRLHTAGARPAGRPGSLCPSG